MHFERVVIDENPSGTDNDLCFVIDVNGDGRNDVIIGGAKGTENVVWYENPTWKRHVIGTGNVEAGGALGDISGNGTMDLIGGNQGGPELYWFEHPEDPTGLWPRHLICSDLFNYHDNLLADIDNDGKLELVVPSQGKNKQNGILTYYKIPDDPTIEPWPEENRHVINKGLILEGLACADIDGDGLNELVAGPYWFKLADGEWQTNPIDGSFGYPRVAVGDINGDGKPEVVISEGESNPGRLAWFSAYPDFTCTVLAGDLFHPHSLELADFTGDGTLDIMVGEMGLGRNENPKIFLFLNNGDGTFEKTLVGEGYPTHDSKAGVLDDSGRPSIVGKPYNPINRVEIWFSRE